MWMWLFWIHIGLLVTASPVLCLSECCFSLAEYADSYFMSLPAPHPTPGFVSAVPICLSLNVITDFLLPTWLDYEKPRTLRRDSLIVKDFPGRSGNPPRMHGTVLWAVALGWKSSKRREKEQRAHISLQIPEMWASSLSLDHQGHTLQLLPCYALSSDGLSSRPMAYGKPFWKWLFIRDLITAIRRLMTLFA